MLLTSQKINLAPFNEADLDLFIEMSMSLVMMEHVYEPCSFEEANAGFITKSQPWSLENDGWLSLGISKVSIGEKIENIGLKITNHEANNAGLSFMIKPSAQGKGFAGEALELAKKYGFIREGCLKQNVIINDKYVDDYIYGLCKPAL